MYNNFEHEIDHAISDLSMWIIKFYEAYHNFEKHNKNSSTQRSLKLIKYKFDFLVVNVSDRLSFQDILEVKICQVSGLLYELRISQELCIR